MGRHSLTQVVQLVGIRKGVVGCSFTSPRQWVAVRLEYCPFLGAFLSSKQVSLYLGSLFRRREHLLRPTVLPALRGYRRYRAAFLRRWW